MANTVYGVSLGAHKPFVDEEIMDSRSHVPRGLPISVAAESCRPRSSRWRLCQHRAISAGHWIDGEQRLLVPDCEPM